MSKRRKKRITRLMDLTLWWPSRSKRRASTCSRQWQRTPFASNASIQFTPRSSTLMSSPMDDETKSRRDCSQKLFTKAFYSSSSSTANTLLTSDNLILHDVPYETILFFMECLEHVTFSNSGCWRSASSTTRPAKMISCKHNLMPWYEKYFSQQATNPLNISENVCFQVKKLICSINQSLREYFDLLLRIVEYLLDRNYLLQAITEIDQEFLGKINQCKNWHAKRRGHHHTPRRWQPASMQIEKQWMFNPDDYLTHNNLLEIYKNDKRCVQNTDTTAIKRNTCHNQAKQKG